tara:strand:+ start:3810 stop:5168 length:1359 start_codon:yes stop_codon:yes gene_type:complete
MFFKTLIFYLLIFQILAAQEIITEYLVNNNDTIDIFSYQIPSNYNQNNSHPLLVAFHQWGGNHNSTYSTNFDEEANNRGWFFLSPFGGAENNYNNQNMQNMVENEIKWLIENYSINKNKIYMVGGSMGGAAGSIYSNNHLDPNNPMIAATASASGILDCERRYYEMDGNNSMIEWFGGTPEEVPFEYHRNSTVFFYDSLQSMHYNLKYLPIYLDFGSTEAHRYHAEDLYDILLDYNEHVWIDTVPSGGHGYSVIDEYHACNWLSQFSLYTNPEYLNVNLDEVSRAYWFMALNHNIPNQFIRFEGSQILDSLIINQLSNTDSIKIFIYENNPIEIKININLNIAFNLNLESNSFYHIDNFNLMSSGGPSTNTIFLQNNTILINDLNQDNYLLLINYFEDINLDGIWDINDLIFSIQYILSYNNFIELQILNADLNNDSKIDIFDIIIMLNLII